jgi:hypothetical protein
MKSLLYSLTLFAALTRANGSDQDQCPQKRNGCLGQNDVNHILNNWPRLFDTEDANWLINNINCTVTEDFVSYNEGSMFSGQSFVSIHLSQLQYSNHTFANQTARLTYQGIVNNGIDIASRADLLHENLINIQYEAGYPNTRGHYTKVTEFHSCNHIAFRWMYNGTATGNIKW